jgi:hypothetical protein
VSISSTLFRMPSCVLKPTIILGTPSRKDWIQNFISFRSKVTMSLSFRISALVFSSTQFIGLSSVGLESQTDPQLAGNLENIISHTCIHLSTENHHRVSYSSLHYGTILSVIVDSLVLSVFDIFSRSLGPCLWKQAKSLEFITLTVISRFSSIAARDSPQKLIISCEGLPGWGTCRRWCP